MAVLGVTTVVLTVVGTRWSTLLGPDLVWSSLFLAMAAVAGELRPIRLTHGDESAGTLSTSASFILSLVAVSGVGLAVAAQTLASLVDDLAHRREAKKSLFNTGQYALSVAAARAVYCAVTGVPFLAPPGPVTTDQLAGLFAAGIVMTLVNRLLVAGVVALATGQRFTALLTEDAKYHTVTNLVLISIGCIAARVAGDGVGVLILLSAPVVAAYLMADAAIRQGHLASHDTLTGLGNRDHLARVLDGALTAAHGERVPGPGLVLLDLDHFKDINDTLGHPFGDKLLRQVANRLTAALPDGAVAHRLGGDEFAVVVPGDVTRTQRVARDLLVALDAPVRLEGLELLIRASAGVAVAPGHGHDAETLMKRGDVALYHAKLERDRVSTYSPDFDVNTLDRLQLLTDLRAGLRRNEFSVDYQPQVDLTTHRTVGVEALVRWHHPVRGLVLPDEFIPIAESSGLITPLTEHVLDTALTDLRRWRADGHTLRLAVNLSARHLSDLSLAPSIATTLATYQVPPDALVLEVTETGILSDPARADKVIRALREHGVGIAVDDYGTGNASLTYLKRLDIDELKIDRSFVSDMATDDHSRVIVRSTIALALDLGLRVVAEGIEDRTTADTLASLGQVIGQGYHLGAPTTADAVAAMLAAGRPATTTGR